MSARADYLNKLDTKTTSSIGLKYVLQLLIQNKISPFNSNLLILISNDFGATDFVRLIGPAILNNSYHKTETICLDKLRYDSKTKTFNISNLVLSIFKIYILVSREKIDDLSFEALTILKQMHPKVQIIIDIDDDLFSISKNHPEYDHYINRVKVLDVLINLSDTIVVSTDPIAKKISSRNPKASIIKIPNYLNDNVWNIDYTTLKHNENEILVLYSGTETHDADLRILENIIPEAAEVVKQKMGKTLRIVVAGGTTLNINGMEVLQVPDNRRKYPDYVEWLQSMQSFDFAIAPLDLKNEMNKSKSWLKYLEYSALGLPAIFTNIEPYSTIVKDHQNGILISDNDALSWKKAIIEMATNVHIRNSITNNCKTDLRNNLLLKDHQYLWKNLLEE